MTNCIRGSWSTRDRTKASDKLTGHFVLVLVLVLVLESDVGLNYGQQERGASHKSPVSHMSHPWLALSLFPRSDRDQP